MVERKTPSLWTNVKKSAEVLKPLGGLTPHGSYGVGFVAGFEPGPPNELMVGMTNA